MKKLNIFVYLIVIGGLILFSGCSLFKSGKSSSKGYGSGVGPLSAQELNARREERYAGGSIPLAEEEGVLRDIHFSYDSSDISDSGRQNIERNVQILLNNPNVRIQLEGHCDERGTAEYNMALGARRARAVFDVLVSLGVSSSKLDTISYGEEVPLDSSSNEEAWSRNRRVHFTAFRNLPRR